MKKLIALSLACGMAAALAGCGGAPSSAPASSPEPFNMSTTTPETMPDAGSSTLDTAIPAAPDAAAPATPPGAGFVYSVEPSVTAESIGPLLQMRGDDERGEFGDDFNAYDMYLDENIFAITQNGKCGLIDTDGVIVLPCEYDSFTVAFDKDILALKGDAYFEIDEEDGKYTARPVTGSELPDLQGTAPNPMLIWVPAENTLYRSEAGDTYFASVYDKKMPCPAMVATETQKDGDNQFASGLTGWVLTDGVKAVSEVYDSVGSFSSGIAPVTKDGKAGYIDAAGKVVIPLEYDVGDAASVLPASRPCKATYGTVVLVKDGVWSLCDTTGAAIIPAGTFDAVTPVYKDKAFVQKDGKWGVVRLTGRYAGDQTGLDD